MYLNCHSYYSFKYGTLSIQQLFDEAKRCGANKLVLTDINNTAGYIELLRICNEQKEKHPLDIVLGMEFRREEQLLYIAIAKNNEGFEEINRYLSHYNLSKKPLLSRAPHFDNALVIYPFNTIAPEALRPNEFIGIKIKELNKIPYSSCKAYPEKLVALHPVTLKDRTSYNVHRLLRAISQNTLLSKLNKAVQCDPDEFMLPENELKKYYQQYPQIIRNTERLLEQCHITFDMGADKNKKHLLGNKKADLQYLREEAWKGFCDKYGADDTEALKRFEKELEIISKKNFEAYYLIAYDIVKYGKNQGFEYVGRGSGANSLIAYCLEITNVDPLELDLYFERFLNPQRTSPPDFDMDFSWKDRDDIYRYIFDRYQNNHVALLGTHTTYQGRSTIREIAKVFGLPKEEIDQLVANPAHYKKKDDIHRLITQYGKLLLKIPANLSIHAGGVLITEKPIYAYTTTDLPPKGFPVAHFEMHNAEDMGIYKFDVLSQRGLGHIKDTLSLIRTNRGRTEDIRRFDDFKKDQKIRTLLEKGQTMGCFYVESPAMRMLLHKLECRDYVTLVAASSIIRPGVARSGMMRAYIERHHQIQQGKTYESIHPKMDELLSETYGVMVYQEDVIKVAHHFANLTLTEADVLRRGMSGKYRSRKEFQRVKDAFFDNCKQIGYPDHVTERVWYEIESFSGYSFSKGHSASYAVESFQSLYLKAHYPLEFMVGVINNFGGFYKTEFYFHEARMNGALIEAPCVNRSHYFTSITGKTIYVGFIHIKSLETKIGQLIEQERDLRGDYHCLDNFIRRIPIGLEQIRMLIRIGAFRFTGRSKKELLWEAQLYFGKPHASYSLDLFDLELPHYELPPLKVHPLDDAFDQLELLEFPLCDPFLLLATDDRGNTTAQQLMQKTKQHVRMIGYIVTTKNTSTKDGLRMHFGTFYDHEGNVFDTVHFPNVSKKYPFRGKGFYLLRGLVVEDFGVPMMEVDYMEKLPMKKKFEVV